MARIPKRLRRTLTRMLTVALVWFLGRTTRTTFVNWHVLESLEGKPYLLAAWHNTILFLMYCLGPFHYPVMASRSRDGDDIVWISERFGFQGVRGSTSSGATSALREAMRLLSGGRPVIVTPDGPRGPRYVVKPGIVGLARKKRVPIVPICFSAPQRWEMGSWDRMKLPKPFSRATVVVGDPIWLDDEDSDEETDRLRVQREARRLVRIAERYTGADTRFPDPALEEEDTQAPEGVEQTDEG